MLTTIRPRKGITRLRRFVQAEPGERCEFCGATLAAEHRHLLEPATRHVACSCLVCAEALAARPGATFRPIPQEAAALPDFRISDAEWHSLALPIDIAFIFYGTPEGRPVALYPGPLGAAQSLLGLDAWSALVAKNPVLAEFSADVEALLIDRIKGKRGYYRVPIDRCYALVGLIRTHWRGFNGGDEVWQAIDDFLAALRGAGAATQGGRS
ncbi:MAG TPA: DUF5947 family protein [Stellaceae bacterium]|nr:DUF5947 family protein [Stellaceae bacterium]